MEIIGLFCLGAFVGAVATRGLNAVTSVNAKIIGTVLSAALGGIAAAFISRFSSTTSVGVYCIGLLIALMWAYAGTAAQNVRSDIRRVQVLGWLHIAATVAVSLIAALLVLPPALVEVAKAVGLLK